MFSMKVFIKTIYLLLPTITAITLNILILKLDLSTGPGLVNTVHNCITDGDICIFGSMACFTFELKITIRVGSLCLVSMSTIDDSDTT